MSLYIRRRTPGRRSWLNLSRSGVSASAQVGRATVNSRGRVTIRLGKGIGWRFGR